MKHGLDKDLSMVGCCAQRCMGAHQGALQLVKSLLKALAGIGNHHGRFGEDILLRPDGYCRGRLTTTKLENQPTLRRRMHA